MVCAQNNFYSEYINALLVYHTREKRIKLLSSVTKKDIKQKLFMIGQTKISAPFLLADNCPIVILLINLNCCPDRLRKHPFLHAHRRWGRAKRPQRRRARRNGCFRRLLPGWLGGTVIHISTAQVIETSVTVINSHIQDYVHPDDHTQPTYEMTPGQLYTSLLLKSLIFTFPSDTCQSQRILLVEETSYESRPRTSKFKVKNNGAVVYVGSSLTAHNPLFFVHRL